MVDPKNREQVEIRPGQAYTQDRFGYRRPLVEQTESGLVELPAGTPDQSWTNAQLDAYAGREGIELGAPKNKADRLVAIGGHREAEEPALPPE